MPTQYESGVQVEKPATVLQFPKKEDLKRLQEYEYYEKLFFGEHFAAFSIKIDDPLFSKEYHKLKYIVFNFAGLISKVCSDLLFIEPPKIEVTEGGGDQEFVDALLEENKMRILNYESALSNSYLGDALYKVRIGPRNPLNPDEKSTVIIEDVSPKIYFPTINTWNAKEEPNEKELAWLFTDSIDVKKQYLRKEIHYPGRIVNKVYLMNGDKIGAEEDLGIIGIKGLLPEQKTDIDRSLLIHIPNWRAGNKQFGISDYYDLDTVFYALNNRITKTDNILDKHSDPILSLPGGLTDENGKVKSTYKAFVRPEGATKDEDPAYITWDANLESAFVEIDKLVEIAEMMSEISPAAFGMDKNGVAESGRALKLKLLRTLAKVQRKQLYYYEGLRETIYVAQLMAKAHNIEINGKKMKGEPVRPEIIWRDGLPADMTELVEVESKRIDSGTTTVADSIMRLDDVDEKVAEKKAKLIKDEKAIELPTMNVAGGAGKFGKPAVPGQPTPGK